MIVISGYSVTEELSDTPVFKWIRAESSNRNQVILQIPNPDASWSTKQIQALKDYFLALQGIGGVDHIFPNQLLSDSDPDCKLIIQYPDKPCEPLVAALARAPENANKWWCQACDSLFRLHKEGLAHGYVSLDSFVVVKNRVCLTNFGYLPLLKMGLAGALAEVGSAAAPEVSGPRHEVTKESDIYALAKAVAAWKPGFAQTDIYKEATQDNSRDRCEDTRKIYSGIIPGPKFTVSTTVRPRKAAGTIDGGGDYEADTEIQVKAKPKDGWQFDHWTADLSGHENPATVKVDRSKRIIAVFIKKGTGRPLAIYDLDVEVKPPGAGIVDGGGEYQDSSDRKHSEATIEAKPERGYRFARWEGDIPAGDKSKNPVTLTMNKNKSVVANFDSVVRITADIEPPSAGSVDGTGVYSKGTTVTLEALPASTFGRWEGYVSGSENPISVKAIRDVHVKACFIDSEDATVKRKERLMLVGSPVTICPFLAFMTSLIALWALGISVTSGFIPFLCISGLVADSGIVITRLILGSEKLRRIAVEELDEEDST